MAEKFYSLLTKIGKAKIANSIGFGTKINFTKMKVGDGGGDYYEPTEEQTDLKNTVWEGNINHVEIDKDNPNWIHIELMIPATVGGFTIREYGAFDDENNLIGICKCAETYKPVITDGSTKELLLDLILCVVNTANIQLKIDPTIIFAKKSDLELLENKINNLDGKAVTLRSYSKLEKDTKIIPINIPEFNPLNEDDLEVHMNGRLLTKDINYKIASSDMEIENIDEEILWQTGDEFDIALHKNIKNKVEHIDVGLIPKGSITEDKLNPQIVEKVKEVSDKLPKSDFNNFRKDYVSNNGFAKTTGTSTIYNVTLNPAPTSYVDGLNVTIIPHVDCGDNPKLNVNGLGVTTILKQDGTDIKAGDIKIGKPLSLVRVGSNFFMKGSGGGTSIKVIASGTAQIKGYSETTAYLPVNVNIDKSIIQISVSTDGNADLRFLLVKAEFVGKSSIKFSYGYHVSSLGTTSVNFKVIEFDNAKSIQKISTTINGGTTNLLDINPVNINKCMIFSTRRISANSADYAPTGFTREYITKKEDKYYLQVISSQLSQTNSVEINYDIVEFY